MFGRQRQDSSIEDEGEEEEKRQSEEASRHHQSNRNSVAPDHTQLSHAQIKRATRTRLCWSLLSALLLLISVVFLILVEIGSIRINPILNRIHFIRLDLADIIPVSVPNAVLINSIAQTLGLHDYYTVGLWGYCYGDYGDGFEYCSPPRVLYWFDPVKILQDQLLAGASIALPAQINEILDLIRLVSHWMFGLFLTGACLSFVMIFLAPVAVYTRWASLPIMLFTFLAALFTTVAAVLGTVMFIIMANALTSATQLNIGASIGIQMFTYMWIAAAAAILAWLIQISLCCCCASRRDVRTGRKWGSRKAWQ